jgi:phenylalanyl-tRNA synthetase beta chain
LLALELGAGRPTYEPLTEEPILHPGRSARVTALAPGGAVAISGALGELHPSLVASWELRSEHILVAELSVAGLSGGQPRVPRVTPPQRFPAVDRDLAVVVGDDRPAGDVAAAIEAAGGALLASATLFDVYRGQPLAATERSLAFRLRFVAPDRTLTEAEVDTAVATIVGELERRLGARIRS